MKIDYVRNLQFAYMRIALEEALSKTEEEMLAHNTIKGFLPIQWQQEDDICLLRYDITGKQALDALVENVMADEKVIQSLLYGICVAVRQLEKFLLPQEGLLLRPETIFWDYKTESMYFCYYPGEKETTQVRLRTLMEYILAKTDHKNAMAVELAYGVYEELLKPSFSLCEIQRYLRKHREVERITAEKEIAVAEEEQVEVVPEVMEESPVATWWEGVQKSVMAWVKEQLYKFIERKMVVEPIVFEPEEEEVKQGLPTVLLAEKKEEIDGIFKYEGTHALQDIKIVTLPFIIGSDGNCDGIISQPTISHQHAKITNIDGVYFIEDLNSTNGTKVDGGMLTYKTKVSLRKNESVCFANEPYRFV